MPDSPTYAIGCVSFLNARPLIEGLDHCDDLEVRYDVPSRLLEDLVRGEVDIALCPVIDYQTAEAELDIVPVGGIGCNGPTLTVRLFSRVPIERITRIGADTDSHTSVVLMRVLLNDLYNIQPNITPLGPDSSWRNEAEAALLIGDKVVSRAPDDAIYPHQLDLGEAWKRLTGEPFVFAAWMCRRDALLGDLPQRLAQARIDNADRIDQIAERHAASRGWPVDLAERYLGKLLRYPIGDVELHAMQRFWRRADELGFIQSHRPLRCYPATDDAHRA